MKIATTIAALCVTLLAPSQPTPTLAPHQQLAHDVYKQLILDVVEAKKEDWSPDLDPFTFIEKDGFYYGRGVRERPGHPAFFPGP
jgi:hypothetical protein